MRIVDLIDREGLLNQLCEKCGGGCDADKEKRCWKYKLVMEQSAWIPCSERLPQKAGNYLCTLYYAIPPYHLLHPENDAYIREVSIQYFDGKSFIASVVAWMQMPDAYEPPMEVEK